MEDTNIYGVIYKLENTHNRKVYIGQTTSKDPSRYYKTHYVSNEGRGRRKLCNAIKKYGIENFCFAIIDTAYSKEELDKKEIFFIKKYDCLISGYNCISGGSFGKHSEETKRMISLKLMGKASPRKGVKVSDESKKKMSIAKKGIPSKNKGKHLSASVIDKMSTVMRLKIENGFIVWSKGVNFTDEHRLKISMSKKGMVAVNYKKTRFDLNKIRELNYQGNSQTFIAKLYNTDQGTISRIINKINYNY